MIMVNLSNLLFSLGLLIAAVICGLASHFLITRLLDRWHSHRPFAIRGMLLKLAYWHQPLRAILPAVFVAFVLPLLQFPPLALLLLRHALRLWFIAALAWFLIRTIAMARDMILSRYDLTVSNNLDARRAYTQIRLFERVLGVIILVFTAAAMLMTFSTVRELGVSILASAGLVGLVIGFAAQRSIATLLAGMHIAITQPIRLEDAVLVEDEFGWIEEITLSYVVVRVWDQRRLIVPITHFIEKPFQNWTRKTAALTGAVYLYCDYKLPVQEIRKELRRIVESTDLWDKNVCSLQVTKATADTIELRALCSGADASRTWNLRCYVREKLIEFMQTRFADSLPRTRVELERTKAKVSSLTGKEVRSEAA
jgi:small-conductance mechanosensitive channel